MTVSITACKMKYAGYNKRYGRSIVGRRCPSSGPNPERLGGSRGRPRDFDQVAAVHIALMAELVRLGLGSGTASAIAKDRPKSKQLCLVFGVQPGALATAIGEQHLRRAPLPIAFDSEDELPGKFARLGINPAVYTVINVELIADRMGEANERWEQGQKP
jgi:hypothetical protein